MISPPSTSEKVRRSKELADNYHQSRLWSGLGSFCYARLSKHDKTPPDISNVNICLLVPLKPSYVAKIPPKVLFNKPQCSCQRRLCQSYSAWCHPSSTGIVPAWPSKQKLMKHSHWSSYHLLQHACCEHTLSPGQECEIQNAKACRESFFFFFWFVSSCKLTDCCPPHQGAN